MKRQIYCALVLSVSFLFVPFGLPQSSVAQTRKQPGKRQPPKNQAKPQPTPTPDPHAKEREELSKAIDEACTTLEQTIIKANAEYSQTPFDSLAPSATFGTTCKADGTIDWTTTRNGSYGGDLSNTRYTIYVRLRVTDLTLGDLMSSRGVVVLGANDRLIQVNGPTVIGGVTRNASGPVDEWWIDLREEGDLTKDFKDNIRRLVEKLTARAKLPPVV